MLFKKKKKKKKTLKEKMLQHYSLQLLLQDQPRPVSKVLILPLYIPAVCGQHKMTGYNINKKKVFLERYFDLSKAYSDEVRLR